MPTLDRSRSVLCLIDFQEKLMRAIDGAEERRGQRRAVAGRGRDPRAAGDHHGAEPQGPRPDGAGAWPGPTAPTPSWPRCASTRAEARGVFDVLPAGHQIVLAGCEAHVCVLQTALGLLDRSRRVYVVADAVGSRRPESKEAALRRLERAGAEIVTTEMVIFEWLGTAEDPAFKAVMALVK